MRWGMAALLAVMVIPGAAWLDAASALQAHEVQAYAEKRDRSAPISPFAVRTALENEDWRTSARLLQEIVAGNEHDGKAWFFLGFSPHKAGRLHEAIEAHARAAQFDEVRQTALYNWGCALALLNQTEKAIEKLTEAADCGFVDCADIATDSDLDSLHRHPKFDELRQRMSGASELQQAQKLDFLIGSWDVLNNDGKQTAKMTFRKQSNGFLIVEKRTDLSVVDDPGSAVSCLDPTGKVQKHTRIDANNRVFEYTGDATGGAIQMTGTVMHRNGECLLSRLKLELKANDLVVQRVSEADCDTANWTIQFTGTFRRCMEDG